MVRLELFSDAVLAIERIADVDRPLVYLNFLVLATVAVLPFPTAVLADYLRSPENAHAARVLYSFAMATVCASLSLLLLYLRRHPHLLVHSVTTNSLRPAVRRSILGPIAYVGAALIALLSAYAALGLSLAIGAFFALTGSAD